MWLTANPRPTPGASAHQFAAFRVALGLCLVVCVGAGLGAFTSSAWLELDRGLRAAVRLVAILAGSSLALGAFRRTAASLALLVSTIAGVFGYIPYSLAAELCILALLVALAAFGDEPWALKPSTELRSEEHPQRHWTTAAWAGFGMSSLLAATATPSWVALPTLVVCLLGLVWIAARGPQPWLVCSLFAAQLFASAMSPAPLAHLLLAMVWVVALVDESWFQRPKNAAEAVLFYDGVCGLCQSSVQLIVREDRSARLKLAPLQGQTARQKLPPAYLVGSKSDDPDAPDSMVVLDGERMLRESDAALFIAEQLGGAWRLLTPLRWLPRGPRDAAYAWVARNRYAWFGKLDACPIPSAAVRARFLP